MTRVKLQRSNEDWLQEVLLNREQNAHLREEVFSLQWKLIQSKFAPGHNHAHNCMMEAVRRIRAVLNGSMSKRNLVRRSIS